MPPSRQQLHAGAQGRLVLDLGQDAAADGDHRVSRQHQSVRLLRRDGFRFLPREPQRMLPRKLAPRHALINVGGYDCVRLDADAGEEVEAARLADARISRICGPAGIAGRSGAAGHEAIGDPALGKVIGRQFDEHFVAGQHTDAVLAHLAGGMAENLVAVLEADAKHRIGQQLHYLPAHLEQFFLGQADSSPLSAKSRGALARRPGKCEAADLGGIVLGEKRLEPSQPVIKVGRAVEAVAAILVENRGYVGLRLG